MIKLNRQECRFLLDFLSDEQISEAMAKARKDECKKRTNYECFEMTKAAEGIRKKILDGAWDRREGFWNPKIRLNMVDRSRKLNKKYYPNGIE